MGKQKKKPAKPHLTFASHLADPRWEGAGLVILICSVIGMLWVSWRKWPDPIVDFGRELYYPWRITEGALLYRDLQHIYGPLSHYFNALVFQVFGVGFMSLVTVNLAIYLMILGLIYYEVRAGWGRLAAFAGCLFFALIFSFCQFVGIGNYNFAAPYAHETTHGFFLVLALIALWHSWLRNPRPWKALLAGICCGLCVLLKAEFILTAGIVTLGALIRAFLTRPELRSLRGSFRHGLSFLAGGLLPVVLAALFLWRTSGEPLLQALAWANNAWLSLFQLSHITSEPTQQVFLGTANLAENLKGILIFGPLSVAAVYVVALVCQQIDRGKIPALTGVVLCIVAALAPLGFSWIEIGKVFPAWLCLAAFLEWRRRTKSPEANADLANIRWLLLLAAFAFLTRMALNPRIYHYGYFQAALAGVVTMAIVFAGLPDWLNIRKSGRLIYTIVLGIFLMHGVWNLEKISLQLLSYKTTAVGEGSDRFYGFNPNVEPSAILLEETRKSLATRPDLKSLFVIPEGLGLNYLLRRPNSVPYFMLVPSLMHGTDGDKIVSDLNSHPPDCVVLISRDLREFGVARFGNSPENGERVLSWIDWNYRPIVQFGADPLDPNQRGATIYQRQGGSVEKR